MLRVCAAALVLAGCAGAGPATDVDPTASAAGPIAAASAPAGRTVDGAPGPVDGDAPSTGPGPGREQAMISFAVEGGFTGQMRSLRVDRDGRALVEVSGRSASGQLDRQQVDAIVAELDASGLFDRDRSYPGPEGADLQRFEITYAGATVVAYDPTVPPELTEAVRLLEEALRAAQR